MNMDAIMCIDDMDCKKALQVLTDEIGKQFLLKDIGLSFEDVEKLSKIFGISGICNILGAIKTAKYYELTENHNIFTMATDNFDRYYSVMNQITEMFGTLTTTEAAVRFNSIFKGVKLDYIEEGTMLNKKRWHNLKYYTWVEQQGKTVEELNAQKSQDYWIEKQQQINEIDLKLKEVRGF
ncbi:hypothetical protein SDC9_174802 [bioreactor metagenome]|uniref:Uncharacterized protein n=1 Tax=bioreactor metagenome TaxID=1076179 RepID=A0A645GK79_9ZZZZ